MGDAASTLISGPTEEALREAAQEEVQQLTKEYRLCLAQSLFLSVSEEDDVTEKVKWKLKRRTWKSYNRALHEAWCYVKAPAVNKKWKRLYCVARPDYTFEAYDTKESYSSASKPKYSLRPSGYCILHDADQWKHLWTRRTAILLQLNETPKIQSSKEKNSSPADYTICLSHPIKEPLFIGVETPADKEVWNLILCDFIRRTADLNTVDDISKHALGAAIERTRKLHQWRDPDLVSAGDELDVIYHVVTERLLGELGSIARGNPKLKNEKFLEKQKAIEHGFELAKQIARDTVMKLYQARKSTVEVEIRALRPMLMKDLKKLKHNKINKRFSDDNVNESFVAMEGALHTLGPALDSGLTAVKCLFCDAVKELKAMILRKPVYVNHVDIWFLRSMDPLSRDPLKLRPLLKSLIKLPRPAAAAAYIHCQELLDSIVWTFENQVSEGAMRNNGRLDKDEVLKLEEKVLERLDFDLVELRKMMLAKWLLNEGRLKIPYTISGIEENFKEKNPQDIFMRPRLVQERVLLEKLRNHADELVTPRPPTPPTPIPPTPEPPTRQTPPIETEPVIKSEPPSPQFSKTDSFLASVVQSAKDLNIDLTEVPIVKPSPKQTKKPDVTVSRSHTCAAAVLSSESKSKTSRTSKTPSFEMPPVRTISSSSDKTFSANPSVLNPAQLQALQKIRGIKPKPLPEKSNKDETTSKSSSTQSSSKPGDDVPNVSVNYRNMNPYQTGFDGDGNSANHVADVLTQVKSISLNQAPVMKPTVICAKPTSPHVQALNERYAAQEAEVQKAEREREKRDAIDKANSSAHSDGSVKSSSIRLRKARAPKASPKPRTEQWVQEHMNKTIISSDEEMEQKKLNDDYEKRKHLYENLPNVSNRSSPMGSSRLTSSQPHLNLLKTEENLRSRSAVQGTTIISDMKLGSEPECTARSTESIPTKNTNRKKRAQERKNATNNDSSENEPEIPKDSLKSKSQIMNSDPINGREQVKRKKKKKKVVEKVDEEKIEDIKPDENGVKVKGYKDFNQLQAEVKLRDKELKKKRKAKRKSEIDDSENGSRTGSNQLEQNNNHKSYSPTELEEPTVEDPTGNPDLASMSSSDEDNDELPETYIEEIVTERQFIDSDGNVQTEVTTVEQVKTKKKKKINQKNSKQNVTKTEHIDVATGIQDSVIKKTLKQKIKEKEEKMKKLRAAN